MLLLKCIKVLGVCHSVCDQTICVGNMDIIKRTCQFKTQITLHGRNSVVILLVPALILIFKPLVRFQLNMCIVIISILKHVSLYRELVLLDKFSLKSSSPLRKVLRVSRIHTKLLSVIRQHFIPCFLIPIGPKLTSAVQPVLCSTCPNHLILLLQSTTSKTWMPSFERKESELASSFALILQNRI